MKSTELEVGAWYRIHEPTNRYGGNNYTAQLVKINDSKGHHLVREWQAVWINVEQRELYQLPQLHKLSDYQKCVSSKAIIKQVEDPTPAVGSQEWGALEHFTWEQTSKETETEYQNNKIKDLADHFLPMMEIKAHYSLGYQRQLSVYPANIERLHRALTLLVEHDLFHEVFDITDKPVVTYQPPTKLEDKETTDDDHDPEQV